MLAARGRGSAPPAREQAEQLDGLVASPVEPVRHARVEFGGLTGVKHQVVRAKDGTVLDDRTVKHVYTMRDGLVARMDVLQN